MKKTKLILLMAMVTVSIFSTIVFTACTKKSSCGSIICQNGGTCSGGSCNCPSGFTGSFCEIAAVTGVSYQNNTFTPVTIVVNGDVQTIPVGGAHTFKGKVGTVASGTAITSGAASSLGISTPGGIIGLTISWDINNPFPAKDTLRVPLDVGATYFFLRMTNTGSKNIINYYVNYAFPYGILYQDVTVPNNGVTYDLGYYLAYSNSNVQTQASDSKIVWKAVSLPFTSNQSFSVTIN